MKNPTLFRKSNKGFTLLEVVLVTALIVGLLSIMVYNFGPFQEGQNAALCKTNVTKVQQAMRAFAMLNNRAEGAVLTAAEIATDSTTMLASMPVCKTTAVAYVPIGTVPAIGVAYIPCTVTGTTYTAVGTAAAGHGFEGIQ